MIKGAIFDVDGTLLDSIPVWNGLGERYLLANGKTPDRDFNRIIKNMSLYESAYYVRERYGITKDIDKILSEIDNIIGDFYKNEVKLKPGVAEFLEMLSGKSVKMGVATAGSAELAKAAFKRNGILDYFCFILDCDERFRSKETPEIYIAARELLGSEPENTWVFEDAFYAARTAKNAGFKVSAVYDKEEKNPDELKEIADVYFDSFGDAFGYFK